MFSAVALRIFNPEKSLRHTALPCAPPDPGQSDSHSWILVCFFHRITARIPHPKVLLGSIGFNSIPFCIPYFFLIDVRLLFRQKGQVVYFKQCSLDNHPVIWQPQWLNWKQYSPVSISKNYFSGSPASALPFPQRIESREKGCWLFFLWESYWQTLLKNPHA